jgi:hypothetical protein
MLGATETTMYPDVAPVGIVVVMDVPLHELIVTGTSFNNTTLLLCVVPNPEPEITTWLPIDPVVAETLVITGAGAAVELIDTLSNVAVVRWDVLSELTANPMYTFDPMLIVCDEPTWVQFTPSGAM